MPYSRRSSAIYIYVFYPSDYSSTPPLAHPMFSTLPTTRICPPSTTPSPPRRDFAQRLRGAASKLLARARDVEALGAACTWDSCFEELMWVRDPSCMNILLCDYHERESRSPHSAHTSFKKIQNKKQIKHRCGHKIWFVVIFFPLLPV